MFTNNYNSKTPSDNTLLGRTSRKFFVMIWWLLLLFSLLEVFTFPGYFSLPPVLHSGFSGPWRPPPALSSTLATFGCLLLPFFVTFLPRMLRFWVGLFYPWALFTLHSFVCDSDEARIFLCVCPHRVVHSGWRLDLNYWCLNYKAIDLSIAPVSHEV